MSLESQFNLIIRLYNVFLQSKNFPERVDRRGKHVEIVSNYTLKVFS